MEPIRHAVEHLDSSCATKDDLIFLSFLCIYLTMMRWVMGMPHVIAGDWSRPLFYDAYFFYIEIIIRFTNSIFQPAFSKPSVSLPLLVTDEVHRGPFLF